MDTRIKVKIHPGDTVVNQCAIAGLNAGKDVAWFKEFLKKAEQSEDADTIIKIVLTHFDVEIIDPNGV